MSKPLPGEDGLKKFKGLLPESQGQCLVLTIANMPCSLDSVRVQGAGFRMQEWAPQPFGGEAKAGRAMPRALWEGVFLMSEVPL